MSVIALIPARSGSKGIPGKNFRELGGKPLWQYALECAWASGSDRVVASLDDMPRFRASGSFPDFELIDRPAELAQDETPMIDVVTHAMAQIPGAPEDIWVLLQPTQPFRTAARVREAIALLQESGADSVVSVVPLPLAHSPEYTLVIHGDLLSRWDRQPISDRPACRQWADRTYRADGTVYAFRRATVERWGHIYGGRVRPLILEPHETCELDTPDQWAAVEARWEREHAR